MRLRNSVILVEDGIGGDTDAVVEATSASLADAKPESTISGDPDAFGVLVGLLDRDIVGWNMHQR